MIELAVSIGISGFDNDTIDEQPKWQTLLLERAVIFESDVDIADLYRNVVDDA